MMYFRSNLSNKQSAKKLNQVGTIVGASSKSSKKYEPAFGSQTSTGAEPAEDRQKQGGGTLKLILISLAFGAMGLVYLNHVFSTQVELEQVMQLQREYERARRVNADRKFTYDRMIGPAEVYERAKKLGLIDGGPVNGTVTVKVDG